MLLATMFVTTIRRDLHFIQRCLHTSMFYESLGSPRFVSAPMVAQSYLPWRLFVRKHGADLAFSQMLNANNFCKSEKYRHECIDWNSYAHISGSKDLENAALKLDASMIVQLAGDDENLLVTAGKFIHKEVKAIDLNLGCPQHIARRGHYGAYLLPEKQLIVKLLTSMVKELDCPITAKVRMLPSEKETIDLCQAIESCGVSMLTIHGRLVTASKLFTGPANWDIIRKVKQSLSIPVIANGGIGCYADAVQCLEITGADGVMSSEALLENPKMFSEEGDYLFQHDFARAQIRTVREFIEITNAYPHNAKWVTTMMRAHLFKMLHRFLCASQNADLQRMLATSNYSTMCTIPDILEERFQNIHFDNKIAVEKGYLLESGYYMRHRDAKAAIRTLSLPKTAVTEQQQLECRGRSSTIIPSVSIMTS